MKAEALLWLKRKLRDERKIQLYFLFSTLYLLYCSGKVGDWKNWFTAEQRKVCDKLWEKEMSGSKFQFVYDETELKSRL